MKMLTLIWILTGSNYWDSLHFKQTLDQPTIKKGEYAPLMIQSCIPYILLLYLHQNGKVFRYNQNIKICSFSPLQKKAKTQFQNSLLSESGSLSPPSQLSQERAWQYQGCKICTFKSYFLSVHQAKVPKQNNVNLIVTFFTFTARVWPCCLTKII